MNNNQKFIKNSFYIFILIYSFLIIYKANFGILDDHSLLPTLLSENKNFLPLLICPKIGRFFPLCGFECNIISFISTSPVAFYSYNSFQFLVVVLLFYKILSKIGKHNNSIIYTFILFLILNPGFITSWLRLFVPERNSVFFFLIFLYFYIKFQNNQKNLFLIIGLLSANFALYYKEPGFIMLGTFSFLHLIFGWKKLTIKQKLFDVLLLFSSVIFILLYYFIVYINRGDVLYGQNGKQSIFFFLAILISFLLNNPLLFLNLVLFIWRIFNIVKKIIKFNVLYDSMSFTAIIYCFVYFKLKIFSPYYLLPAYVFALPALLFYLKNITWEKNHFLKIITIISVIFVFTNSLPTGIHYFSFYKNVPLNFQKTLTFLESYINKEFEQKKRTNIFLYGIYREVGIEIYCSFIKYLEEYKNLSSASFDFRTDINYEHDFQK